jgi:hypothetical protein
MRRFFFFLLALFLFVGCNQIEQEEGFTMIGAPRISIRFSANMDDPIHHESWSYYMGKEGGDISVLAFYPRKFKEAPLTGELTIDPYLPENHVSISWEQIDDLSVLYTFHFMPNETGEEIVAVFGVLDLTGFDVKTLHTSYAFGRFAIRQSALNE